MIGSGASPSYGAYLIHDDDIKQILSIVGPLYGLPIGDASNIIADGIQARR